MLLLKVPHNFLLIVAAILFAVAAFLRLMNFTSNPPRDWSGAMVAAGLCLMAVAFTT